MEKIKALWAKLVGAESFFAETYIVNKRWHRFLAFYFYIHVAVLLFGILAGCTTQRGFTLYHYTW